MKRILGTALALTIPTLLAAQAATSSGVVPQPDAHLPLKHQAQPTTAAITPADLMTRLYIFADDSMQGREAGTAGNVRGTTYLADQAAKIGLVPAGDDGTYFQTLPFKVRTIDSTSALTADGSPVAYGTEWAATGLEGASFDGITAVYGGEIGDSSLTDEQAKGKLVVFQLGDAGFRALRSAGEMLPSAKAVAIVISPQIIGFASRPQQFLDSPDLRQQASGRPVLFVTAEGAAKLFAEPLDALKAGADGRTVALDLKMTVTPVEFPARNVVGIIPGSDPALKNEYVAVGAHNDHIGFNTRPVDHDSLRIYNHIVRPGGAEDRGAQATPDQQLQINTLLAEWRKGHPGTQRLDSISNGADDDGSGSVSVLEIAQKIMAMNPHPQRSILFVWHVGEEKGLLGSEYFTDHPTVPLDSIVAQLNIDMVGRGDAWDQTGRTKDGARIHGGKNYVQLVGSRRLSTELGDLAEKVNQEDKHDLTFDYSMDADGHPMNIYCRSDHYSYARYGIPIIFFTTGGHSDYHQVTDEPEYIDYAHMARVDNFIADLAVHVADLDHRPVVDHPKPDPHGRCVQ